MISSEGRGLIFLVSQPRSGSTVLQKIISNNNEINTASEPWVLFHYLSVYNPQLVHADFNYEVMSKAVIDFIENSGEKAEEKLKQQIISIYNGYMQEGYRYFMDKTPRYYEILPLIQKIFPAAKIIILLRNPIDVLKSIVRTWQLLEYEKLYIFHRDIIEGPRILADFSHKQQQNPQVFTINFESLFEDNHKSLGSLFDWLGIPFRESFLHYKNNKKADGILGDRTFSVSSGQLKKNKEYEQDVDFGSEFWQKFIQGYMHYLRQDLPQILDNYQFEVKPAKNREFYNFLDYCKFRSRAKFKYADYVNYHRGKRILGILPWLKKKS